MEAVTAKNYPLGRAQAYDDYVWLAREPTMGRESDAEEQGWLATTGSGKQLAFYRLRLQFKHLERGQCDRPDKGTLIRRVPARGTCPF
jgi:hypothetical protein